MDADVPRDERHICVRRSRVVLAPRRWRQVVRINPRGDGARKPGPQGEREISRQPPRRGCRTASAEPVCSCAFSFALTAHGTAGAACTRHSLRPYFERATNEAKLGRSSSREREGVSSLQSGCVGWAKAHLRRAHHHVANAGNGGHASAFARRATADRVALPTLRICSSRRDPPPTPARRRAGGRRRGGAGR